MIEETITIYDIPLEVTAEIDVEENEPYSYGWSRGKEAVVYLNSVKVGGQDILDLLSDRVLEKIGEKVKEVCDG